MLSPCTAFPACSQSCTCTSQVVPYAAYAGALCLDGPTLTNLELLESSTGSTEGSLLTCLDSCTSAGLLLLLKQPAPWQEDEPYPSSDVSLRSNKAGACVSLWLM